MNQDALPVDPMDHLLHLIQYLERCIATGAKWSLDGAEAIIRVQLSEVDRATIKNVAAMGTGHQLNMLHPHSPRAQEILRL